MEESGKDYWAAAEISGAEHSLYFARNLSAEGERLFFESYERLVPADTNGMRDVYQWEAAGTGSCTEASPAFSAPAGGCVNLISSGRSNHDSEFTDATPSGDDAFFRTAESLVDRDPGQFDIYDARIGGGFAEASEGPPCEGDACQSPAAAPEAATPASSTFRGPGNLAKAKAPRCPKAKRRVHNHGRVRCVPRHHRRAQRHHGRAAR